jgi:hypothetical protein
MRQYQPTIIEIRSLLARLLIQIAFLRDELKRSWIEFKNNPSTFSRTMTQHIVHRLRTFLATPNVIPATLTAVAAITCVILVVVLFDKRAAGSPDVAANNGDEEVVFLDGSKPLDSTNKPSIGKGWARSSRVSEQERRRLRSVEETRAGWWRGWQSQPDSTTSRKVAAAFNHPRCDTNAATTQSAITSRRGHRYRSGVVEGSQSSCLRRSEIEV